MHPALVHTCTNKSVCGFKLCPVVTFLIYKMSHHLHRHNAPEKTDCELAHASKTGSTYIYKQLFYEKAIKIPQI